MFILACAGHCFVYIAECFELYSVQLPACCAVPCCPVLWFVQALTEAAAEEGGLLAAEQQHSAGAAMREAARSATEAQVARLTAARLNARVTALEGELAELAAAKEALEGG